MYQGVEAYPRWGPASLLIHTLQCLGAVGPAAGETIRAVLLCADLRDFTALLAASNFVECELPHKSLADPPLFLANEWSGVTGRGEWRMQRSTG
jgi:hypothetical protein